MYAIELIVTPDQIDQLELLDPQMESLFSKAIKNGVQPIWEDRYEGTRYRFTTKGALRVPNDVVSAVMAVGGIAKVAGGFWVEVPTTAVDNLIPVDWPHSRKTVVDPDTGEETEVRRKYEEVTAVILGDNGTSLLRCGIKVDGASAFLAGNVDTQEMCNLYATQFGTSLMFRGQVDEWRAANVADMV